MAAALALASFAAALAHQAAVDPCATTGAAADPIEELPPMTGDAADPVEEPPPMTGDAAR